MEETGDGPGAGAVVEDAGTSVADVRNVNTKIEGMLAVNPGDDVGAVEMVFGAAGIGLRAAAGKGAGHDDLRSFDNAGAGLIVLSDKKAELVDPVD
jgi:hypothetical protein